MDRDYSVTAIFQPTDLLHTLSVAKMGKGKGTVTSEPSGLECGSLCSEEFLGGTPVVLHANAASGSSFGGWSGDCSGTRACLAYMDADKSVTASFTASADETALVRSLSGIADDLVKFANQSGFGLPYHAPEPGVLTIALYDVPTGRLATISRVQRTLIGSGRYRFRRAKTARIEIALTSKGKALVKRSRRLRLTVKGAFTAHGRVVAAATETFVRRASAGEQELDRGELKTLVPSCPGGCELVARQTGFQESLPDGSEPDRMSRAGLIVGWSIKLSRPSPSQIAFGNAEFGGEPRAQLALLRPTGRPQQYRLVASSPTVDLLPYLGQETRFTLTQPLPAKLGDVAALSVPTWAPAFAVGLGANARHRTAEPGCTTISTWAAQTMLGSVAPYSCEFTNGALTYSAIEIAKR
jgi:hypothetical protein